MSDFKGRHFGAEIVLWAVRWYCRYPISYRDLEAMMTERGLAVDHSTTRASVRVPANRLSGMASSPRPGAVTVRRRDVRPSAPNARSGPGNGERGGTPGDHCGQPRAVKREELKHVIRAVARIAGERELVVIGSQAILGEHPDAAAGAPADNALDRI